MTFGVQNINASIWDRHPSSPYIRSHQKIIPTSPPAGATLFSDDFATGDLTHTENGIAWNGTQVGSQDFFAVAAAPGGGNGARFTFTGNADLADSAFVELRFTLGAQYSEIWLGYDLYFPANFYHRRRYASAATSNNKGICQLWTGTYGTATAGQFLGFEYWANADGSSYMTWNPACDLGAWRPDHQYQNITDNFFNLADAGTWVSYVIRAKISDSNNDNGIVQCWKNGNLILNEQAVTNYSSLGYNYFTEGYILGWANAGFNETTEMYVKNVKFATTDVWGVY